MSSRPSIFEYENYRLFLNDYYRFMKSQSKSFSHRVFARMAGVSSSSFLKKVMDGKSNLSRVTIEKFAKALKLNKEETDFFRNLVLFNQSVSSDERHHFAAEILRSKTYREVHPLKESQYNCFSKWYYIPLRSLVELPGFREDPDWISEKLNPPVSPGDIKKALDDLLQLGLLARGLDGKLSVTQAHVTTPDEITQSSLAHYHLEMLKRGGESIDHVPRHKRDISALTLGISEESAQKIKLMIQDFRRKVVEAIADDKSGTAVYQVNIQLFPLVDLEKKPKEEA